MMIILQMLGKVIKMKHILLNRENEKEAIKETVEAIEKGKVIIIPTDTVYGIAADALNEKAVKKIYELKNREMSKPCNILVSNIEMIKDVTKGISKKEEEIIMKYLPRCINNNI